MKKFFFYFIVILLVVGSIAFSLLNTSLVLEFAIPKLINHQYSSIEIESFNIGRQRFSFPNSVVLSDTTFDIKAGDVYYEFSFPDVLVRNVFKLSRNPLEIKLKARDGKIVAGNLSLDKVRFSLLMPYQAKIFDSVDGFVAADNVICNNYELDKISARVKKKGNRLEIFEIIAESYGGKGQGQISIQNIASLNYVVWMEFVDLDPQKMMGINSEFFGNIKGPLEATIRLVGDKEFMDLLAIKLGLASGGIVKSSLIKKIAGRMRSSTQREKILSSIYGKSEIRLDDGSVHIDKSGNQKTMLSFEMFDMFSGINVKEIVDIGEEKNLSDLLLIRK